MTLNPQAFIYAFRGNELLVRTTPTGGVAIPCGADLIAAGLTPLRTQPLSPLHGEAVQAAELPAETQPPTHLAFHGLRPLHGRLEAAHWRLAGRAVQVVEWDRTHQYCGACGVPTAPKADEAAKRCPQCGRLYFPRLSPAIIVRITDGERLLLARSAHFAPGVYSTLAGFVEPGESLEEAVAREVAEEVGVQIQNIRYFASQPWPFPHSVMIGFTADYAGGELRPQPGEIEDARWFAPAALPTLPAVYSIARWLIDDFVAQRAAPDVPRS